MKKKKQKPWQNSKKIQNDRLSNRTPKKLEKNELELKRTEKLKQNQEK